MNEINYTFEAFEFDGAADYGSWMSHDDGPASRDYEFCCNECGNPGSLKCMSKHTPDVCRHCCPVHASEYEAEVLCEMIADGLTEG